MKVLHLLNTNRFSGAENVVCQIMSMFSDESDIEMVYVSPDGQIQDALRERNIKFIPIFDMSVREVCRVINEVKPDVIHAHDMKASFIASIACKRVPLVSHIHGNHYNSRNISVKSLLYIFAGLKSKRILWVSKSAYDGYVFHKLFSRKSEILYNILDINALYERMQHAEMQEAYDVIYVGRLSYPKNPQRLMNIFRGILVANNSLKCAVVGTGELEEETKEICRSYGLEKNIDFLGFVSNPLKLLKNSKVMIMTSRYEGTPMVALEAMALGVPIVSTPTDGMNELVENGVNGFLDDNDDGLINKLQLIVNDDSVREKLSHNQIQKSKEFNNIERYKETIANSYRG